MIDLSYDVVVVGGGHAGTEAAAAAARCGARTLLITQSLDRIGVMSCNPSIGGVGKGHLVREIDALDGIMARAADHAAIHHKVLNRSKGPAVRGPRIQADRALYQMAVQDALSAHHGLDIRDGTVEDLVVDGRGHVSGVRCADGVVIGCGATVLTTGTFLGAVIHVGHVQTPGGRVGEAPSNALAKRLKALDLPVGRLKTGTPPRLFRDSIDWAALPEDRGDASPVSMSFLTTAIAQPQVECRITGTTPQTHLLIEENLARSALYGGQIGARGPRYCPSIEDKVVRFAGRERHQIFLEPEGLASGIVYPNGISTSLPLDIQQRVIATIPGLAHARIAQAGYAIEYDYVDPRALRPSLEVKSLPRAFFAGQINGTTGYEEAAAQGILAGINAAHCAGAAQPLHLDRSTSYIGVMIDDLTTQGVSEPYRMFTSRAEFRLSLRPDNADLRLTPIGMAAGCVGSERQRVFTAWLDALSGDVARPDSGMFAARLEEQASIERVYSGFLKRQDAEARQMRQGESINIPDGFDYGAVGGLSSEMRERLERARPSTFGALARLPGLTPPAALAVMAYVRSSQRQCFT